jgi:hypothetical protein
MRSTSDVPLTTEIMATAISVAISLYSIAGAAESSLRKTLSFPAMLGDIPVALKHS